MVQNSQGLSMAQMIINASSQHQSVYAQNLSIDNEQSGLGCLKKAKNYKKSLIRDKLSQLTNFEDLLTAKKLMPLKKK